MNYIRLILQLLWRFWFYLNGIIVVILFYPAYFVLLQRKEWFPKVFKLYKICGQIILFNSGVIVKVIRKSNTPIKKPYVICPNHCSYLDIITTYMVVSDYFHFMGKSELKNIPLFGHFFKEMNIPVDRSSIMSSHRAFMRASEDIDKGISVAIFPEATIPDNAPQLKVFKNGAFKLAIEKQIPMLPIAYIDNWKIMPDGILRRMRAGRPGTTRIIVLEPIQTNGMTEDDIPALKNKVFQVLQNTLMEYGEI